ncbi:OTU-domain-containing protein [Trametes cingulata]|nr:OTU-domain-containing protein [Trametes cingulata]
MAPVRLRHPKGVTTIQIDFNNGTVADLQQEIFAATEIPPSQQELKAGYPPHPLTLIPELPVDSLGLKQGEQLVVTRRSSGLTHGSGPPPAASAAAFPQPSPAAAMTGMTASQVRSPAPTAAAGAGSGGRKGGPEYVVTSNGYLIHRVVPDDNSCLFSSIALIFEQNIGKAQSIRQIVADAIREDPIKWDEAILGRPREEYIRTILKPNAWGGAIELSILAEHYGTEIASVDVETGRVDRFAPPPEKDTGNRAIVIYSGIHYDATSVAPMLDAPDEFHQTIWSRSGGKAAEAERDGEDAGGGEEEDEMLKAAKKLADALRAKRAYTNTATFDLKCQICGKGLKGEKEARAHASQTGHVEFGEY